MRHLLRPTAVLLRLATSTSALPALSLLLMVGLATGLRAQDDLENLPRPDGKAADMGKPVQVYILMGQSNMLGFGKPAGLADACKNKGLYPYLINDDGSWTVRKDVRYVRVMCSGSGASKTYNNEWMTIKGNIGPEMGIGHYVGHVTDAPVLILKSCIGNRSLGYDLLPPSAEGYAGSPDPSKRPTPGPWYAGVQYDGDVAAAKQVLADLGKHYPGAKRYEVAGFFFWQGDKDFRNAEHAANYERNLLCLIESLREDFDAPEARFVCATLGQTQKGAGGPQGQILEAQLAIDGKRGKYKAHKGMVASVYSHPLSMGGSSSGHYGGNAETYMNVGQAMGKAMAEMILAGPGAGGGGNSASPSVPGVEVDQLDSSLKKVHKHILDERFNAAEELLRPYLADTDGKGEELLAQARVMGEHLTSTIQDTLDDMEDLRVVGDFWQLQAELARTRKSFEGIPEYDKWQEVWSKDLLTEEAVREMAIGEELNAILAKKERTSLASYHGLLTEFREAHPDSFYADKAEDELAPIQKDLRELFYEIEDLEDLGDMYSKFELIEEARRTYARIPQFDEAHARWKSQAKDPAVKESIEAGEAYVEIFEELAELKEKLAKAQAKNRKISSPSKRTKAEERTMASHLKKLEGLAGKLEKLASEHGEDTYYGRAAADSYEAFTDSKGQTLTDKRRR